MKGHIRCGVCGRDNLHTLAWVDRNNKYVGDSEQAQNGEAWCESCQEHVTMRLENEHRED
jgi:hypothetical protein